MSRTAQMMNFTGRLLDDGRYKLLQVLGTGAYGVVYRAHDLKTATSAGSPVQVAIKILDKRHFTDAAAERVRREVVLHHHVNEHPNIVSMLHTFEDVLFVYIVLDYCPGGDLFTRIADDKMFFRNDDSVKSVFLKILDAVAYCHQKRVYHRDLKPENILCSKDGSQVYVSDFGLCTSGVVSMTWGCGSAPYMSPECVGKDAGYLPYSNRTNDIWALGIILVNMISCRSPWQKAITSDDCFCDFLLNEDYLLWMLPISREANTLLRKIFAYEPSERIDLDTLRREIIALRTFFMNDEELAKAEESARDVAASLGVHVKPTQGTSTATKAKSVPERTPAKAPRAPAPQCNDLPAPSLDITDATSSSLLSSMGPITPGFSASQQDIFLPGLRLQLEGFELTGLIKDEKMPSAPRIRQSAKALAA